MSKVIRFNNTDSKTVLQLLAVWESAVRATHDFLTEADINAIRGEVEQALRSTSDVHIYVTAATDIKAFLIVEADKIEALFVDAAARGQGIGSQLVRYAIDLGARSVTVNEQNPSALGFYTHLGFSPISRSECDHKGRPFPLLQLQLQLHG